MRVVGAGLGLLVVAGTAAGCTGAAPGAAPSASSPTYRTTPIPADEFDYESYLDALRQAAGIENPPETTLVRVIAPDEANQVWSDCMHAAGFDVIITFDGGQAPPAGLPADQAEAYKLADYICYAQYPVDQAMFRDYGEEQWQRLYAYYTDVLTPCLEREGYDVTPAPSYDVFRATIQTKEAWHPYAAVPDSLPPDEWEALNGACPQNPSDEVLFGE